jgi:hypothetical protein
LRRTEQAANRDDASPFARDLWNLHPPERASASLHSATLESIETRAHALHLPAGPDRAIWCGSQAISADDYQSQKRSIAAWIAIGELFSRLQRFC